MRRTIERTTWCAGLALIAMLVACGDDDGAPSNPDAGNDAAMTIGCVTSQDCDDGTYCNGVETCDPNDPNADPVTHCVEGVSVVCDDSVACTADSCDEARGACVSVAPDEDGDGHRAATCRDVDGEPLGDDCDDEDANQFPNNTEACDPADHTAARDEDCNPETFGTRDVDSDNHVDARCCNTGPDEVERCGDDCDDDRASAYAGLQEICDGLDNDCDSAAAIDNGLFCGACMCSVPNATPSCTAGATQCTVGVCDTGYLNCDANQTNGCEARRDADTSCGECGTTCTAYASCGATGSGTFACECDDGFVGDGVTCAACPVGFGGDGAGSCSPRLLDLTVSVGSLSPTLRDGTFEYAVYVPVAVQAITLTADVEPGVSIAIGNTSVISGTPWLSPPLSVGANVIEIVLSYPDQRSRGYTVTVTRGSTIDYVKASNTGAYDAFGGSIAIDGDTMVVGAIWESSGATTINGDQTNDSEEGAGAAYVFVRSGNSWVQQAYLKPPNAEAYDFFGAKVAIDGDTIVVSADEESSADPLDPLDNSAFFAGSVFVFVRNGSTWSQQAYLKAESPDANDYFGNSIAIDGDTLVVGSIGDDSASRGVGGDPSDDGRQDSGAAFVFARDGNNWSQQAFLKADNADGDDGFGRAVGISGDTIVVGAALEDGSGTMVNGDGTDNDAGNAGAAYVFVRSGSDWTQQAYLKASNAQPVDFFGTDVAISGDRVVVGADGEDSDNPGVNPVHNDDSSNVGAAYVFVRSGSNWTQQAYLKASNASEEDIFGNVVRIEGDRIAIGAFSEDGDGDGLSGNPNDDAALGAGAVYLFAVRNDVWSQTAYLKAPHSEGGDHFGVAVSMSQGVVVIGAPEEDSDATGINGDQTSNAEEDSGAVYVFR